MTKETALWFVSCSVFYLYFIYLFIYFIYIILKRLFILYILDLHLEGLPSVPVKEAY